jgi:hypothetical protein
MEIDPKDYDKLYAREGQYIRVSIRIRKSGDGDVDQKVYIDDILDVAPYLYDSECSVILIHERDSCSGEITDSPKGFGSFYSALSIANLLYYICNKENFNTDRIPYFKNRLVKFDDPIKPEPKPKQQPIRSRNELLDISG